MPEKPTSGVESGRVLTPEERIERFLEAWAVPRDKSDVIYGIGVFPDEDGTRDLLASDLRRLLDLVAEFRKRDESASRVIEGLRHV